ncbi:hypothetical protein X727_07410 [Mesorhizobium sp. L103C119B0]|nr:hypothetical protein X727_07410 [Mesorhizobium sp. L103C119B0]
MHSTATASFGEQLQIVRDSMPFGDVVRGESTRYFIGLARSEGRIEQVLDEHVRWPTARQLRPIAGFHPRQQIDKINDLNMSSGPTIIAMYRW